MTDLVEQIRARAALVAGDPDVVKVQSVRDRAVLLEYVTELEVIIARVQEYAYMRNFYNQPMYISELLGIVGEPDDLSAVVVGGEATPTETPACQHDWFEAVTEQGHHVHSCAACNEQHHPWGRYGKSCDGCDVLPGPSAVPVPAETPETTFHDPLLADVLMAQADADQRHGCTFGPGEDCICSAEQLPGGHRIDDEGDQK